MKILLITISIGLAVCVHSTHAQPSEERCVEQCTSVIQQYIAEANGQKKLERSAPTNEQLREWASVYTNNSTILFAAALSYDLNQSIEAALPAFEAAYTASSFDTIIGNMYAGILLMDKQVTKAESVLRELVKNNSYPNNLLPKFTLALVLKGMQRYEEALPLFQEQNAFWSARNIQAAPKPNMDYATILMNIGICQLYLGEHTKSIETLTLAESYWPTAAHIINYQAEAYLKDGQFSKATEILLFAKDNNRCDESTFYHLGLLMKQVDTDLAKSYFERSLKEGSKQISIAPDSGRTHYYMYLVCSELGKSKEAQLYKTKASQLNQTYGAPWNTNQNQRVDLTVKTPVKSGKAQGTAGHP